ncbi:MAG: hypothetical protein MZV70_44975 [Desulfobacterales bacterium]|nr:hypothetical protein [Desulfobacterales bacterium]
MDTEVLKELLADVRAGKVAIEEALEALKGFPFEDLAFAKVDHHRTLRTGIPEVIYARGKTTEEVVAIARSMLDRSGRFLITRASEDVFRALGIKEARFHQASRRHLLRGRQGEEGVRACHLCRDVRTSPSLKRPR